MASVEQLESRLERFLQIHLERLGQHLDQRLRKNQKVLEALLTGSNGHVGDGCSDHEQGSGYSDHEQSHVQRALAALGEAIIDVEAGHPSSIEKLPGCARPGHGTEPKAGTSTRKVTSSRPSGVDKPQSLIEDLLDMSLPEGPSTDVRWSRALAERMPASPRPVLAARPLSFTDGVPGTGSPRADGSAAAPPAASSAMGFRNAPSNAAAFGFTGSDAHLEQPRLSRRGSSLSDFGLKSEHVKSIGSTGEYKEVGSPSGDSTYSSRGECAVGRAVSAATLGWASSPVEAVRVMIPEWLTGFVAHEPAFRTRVSILVRDAQKSRTHWHQKRWRILSPVGWSRMLWDVALVLVVASDLWQASIDAVFHALGDYAALLGTFQTLEAALLGMDVLLRFNTGYLWRGRLVMDRREIFLNYMKFWFWVDAFSAVPPELFGSQNLSYVARIPRCLKLYHTLYTWKQLRALRLARGGHSFSLLRWLRRQVPLEYLPTFIQVFALLLCSAHILACCRALSRWDDEDSFVLPRMARYYDSFFLEYATLTGGLGGGSSVADTGEWLVNMVAASARLWMIIYGAILCSVQAQALFQDDAQGFLARERTHRYLRRHSISLATQLQIMSSISEKSRVRSVQRTFDELMSDAFPMTVRTVLQDELWSPRLLSFDLFRQLHRWDCTFVSQLAMTAREQVHPSSMVLFEAGALADKAYYIIEGRVSILGVDVESAEEAPTLVPDYTDGMWVGEKAFLNPILRRSATVISREVTSTMVLTSHDYLHLLKKMGLTERLFEFCTKNIWKGICGRCGRIGDHFADDCPVITRKANKGWGLMALGSDLDKFLSDQGLSSAAPFLLEWGITSLDDLEAADLDRFNEKIANEMRSQCGTVTVETIRRFRIGAEAQSSALLHFGKSKSQHLVFLSHYKVEAGTEAALMRSEIEQIVGGTSDHIGARFEAPVFLDTEDLQDLSLLRFYVKKSHNLLVMLTSNVLSRPWCLIEIVTAVRHRVRLVPVLVTKPGLPAFKFPTDEDRLAKTEMLDAECMKCLEDAGVGVQELSAAIKELFKRIALPYSPQSSATIRRAQIDKILTSCKLNQEVLDRMNNLERSCFYNTHSRSFCES